MLHYLETDILHWHLSITEPSDDFIAEACGWQAGAIKFLWNEEISTPLKLASRGTLGRGGFEIAEEVATSEGIAIVQKQIHIPRRKGQATKYWET